MFALTFGHRHHRSIRRGPAGRAATRANANTGAAFATECFRLAAHGEPATAGWKAGAAAITNANACNVMSGSYARAGVNSAHDRYGIWNA